MEIGTPLEKMGVLKCLDATERTFILRHGHAAPGMTTFHGREESTFHSDVANQAFLPLLQYPGLFTRCHGSA